MKFYSLRENKFSFNFMKRVEINIRSILYILEDGNFGRNML